MLLIVSFCFIRNNCYRLSIDFCLKRILLIASALVNIDIIRSKKQFKLKHLKTRKTWHFFGNHLSLHHQTKSK